MVTPSVLPPPYKQLLRLLTPYFKMFLERFRNERPSHSVVLSLQAVVFMVQPKLEFIIKGGVDILSRPIFDRVYNSVQILHLKVLVQIDEWL